MEPPSKKTRDSEFKNGTIKRRNKWGLISINTKFIGQLEDYNIRYLELNSTKCNEHIR